MENFDLLNDDLQVTPQVQNYLTESARWGKFLSIVGFVSCVIMVIVAFFAPAYLSQQPRYNSVSAEYIPGVRVAMTVIYMILALLFFFPCFYLYKFSVKMQSAIKVASQENFEESLMNLKSVFRFYGIFTIIIFSVYALAIIIGIIAVAMR